jgi:RNA polymerase-binding protein DksA
MKLSKHDLKQFKVLLLEERAKFAGEIRSLARDASKTPRDASGDLSSHTVHMADMSADTYDREMATNLVSTEQAVLYQIEDALKRFDEGTYGVCQECQKPITMSRLRAVPYTAMCITCQRTKEQKSKRSSA